MKANPAWSRDDSGLLSDLKDFSIVLGGPLFQLLRKARLTDNALRLLVKRIVFLCLLTWLPLLLLAAKDGKLLTGNEEVPFLRDIEVHVRFLVALPLLLIAELVAHRRLRPLLNQFVERGLIPESEMPRFDRAVASSFRLRNSVIAEVLLLAFVYGVGILLFWRRFVLMDADTWYATPAPGGARLSVAGKWYGFVSLPIFQFLLVRWYFRIFIWARFLWQVSRIPLRLVPTHPDRTGGLGFLSDSIYALSLLAVAHGALSAGFLANRIFFVGSRLSNFNAEILFMLALVMVVILGPLFVFAPRLNLTWRKGLFEYGELASRYVVAFDTRWLRGGAAAGAQLLGTSDIQSLADMSNSYEVVRRMRLAPVPKEAVVALIAVTLAPISPLVLTLIPLESLLKHMLTAVF